MLVLICWLFLHFHYSSEKLTGVCLVDATEGHSAISNINDNSQVLLLAHKNRRAKASFLTYHFCVMFIRDSGDSGFSEYKATI